LKQQFLKLVNRLTGISTPVFGLSWQPPALDVEVARRVLTYLEDRRVLFAPAVLEIPEHAVNSVLSIRPVITQALGEVDRESELGKSLLAIRAACRAFLDRTQLIGTETRVLFDLFPFQQWEFASALGELRAIVGLHAARIAVAYGIEVEDDFAAMFPPEVTDEDV
jgi:hypothetical protein